jgi:hypothetical protein
LGLGGMSRKSRGGGATTAFFFLHFVMGGGFPLSLRLWQVEFVSAGEGEKG